MSEPETADDGKIWVQPPLEITSTVIKFVVGYTSYFASAETVGAVGEEDTTDYDAQVTDADVAQAKKLLLGYVVTVSKDVYEIDSIDLGTLYTTIGSHPYKEAVVRRATNWPVYCPSQPKIYLHKLTDPDTIITLTMDVLSPPSSNNTGTAFVTIGDYMGFVDHGEGYEVETEDGDTYWTISPTATVLWDADEAPEGISITGYYPLGYFEAANPVVQEISYLTSDGSEVTSLD